MSAIAVKPNFEEVIKVLISYFTAKYGVLPEVTPLYDESFYWLDKTNPELNINVLSLPPAKEVKVYSWYEEKRPVIYLRMAEDETGILFQYLPGSYDGLSCKFTQDYPIVINILKAFNI